MYSNEDISSLYNYLMHTPEKGLRQMLMGGDFTEAHLRLLVKLVKGAPEKDFMECFTNDNMGKMRLNPNEAKLKENFWAICKKKFSSVGLIKEQKAA